MASGVLPTVDKYICSFERWLPVHLADIADPEHAKTIKLFATWHVLPHLRERAERSHITPNIRRFAAEQIKYATTFLRWLSTRDSPLSSCGQLDIDAWFADAGLLLTGPVCLKIATTVYRFARCCGGDPAYRQEGRPHTMLQIVGPAVVVTSVWLLASGVALAAFGRRWDGLPMLLIHQVALWC